MLSGGHTSPPLQLFIIHYSSFIIHYYCLPPPSRRFGCVPPPPQSVEALNAKTPPVFAGGVRFEDHPAGDFTVNDVLRLDPFGNTAVVVNVTGAQLHDMLIACKSVDDHGFPFTSGMSCEVTYTDKNRSGIKDLKLFGPDGKPLDLKKKYKVIANSYAIITSDIPGDDQGEDLNIGTADVLMKYLEKKKTVNYQGRKCLKENF